jgi:N-acetylglucosamine kinase
VILCFDIGGTSIKVAEAYALEDVRPGERYPTPTDDFDAFAATLSQTVARASTPPERIAISIAGVVNPETGRATVANIPCLTGRQLVQDLTERLQRPVDLANDADCFALAEAFVGAGRGHDVVFGMILGTGVGGGVVVRGELINASGGFAGEIGHGPVAPRIVGSPEVVLPAFPCGCGLSGCLDAVCSARGIERLHAYLAPGATASSVEIVAGWEEGKLPESRTIDLWLDLLAGPLAMVENMLGAGIIAVGGGLSNSNRLIAALDLAVRSRILRRFDRPLVVPAACAIEPGLVGAAILGLRQHLKAAT